MHNSSRKCVRLALLSGILLVALFYFWKPSRKEVDISSSQVTPIKKLFIGKIGDATNGYKDIPYQIKEEMARSVSVTFSFKFKFFFLLLNSLLFPTVVWLKMPAYARLMKKPFAYRCQICSFHTCGLTILIKHFWSSTLILKV